jgi:hypothetical protein
MGRMEFPMTFFSLKFLALAECLSLVSEVRVAGFIQFSILPGGNFNSHAHDVSADDSLAIVRAGRRATGLLRRK